MDKIKLEALVFASVFFLFQTPDLLHYLRALKTSSYYFQNTGSIHRDGFFPIE